MLQNSAILRARLCRPDSPFFNPKNAVPDTGINMRNGRPVPPPRPVVLEPAPPPPPPAPRRPRYSVILSGEWLGPTTASCLGSEGDAQPKPKITITLIQKAVCAAYLVSWKNLVAQGRTLNVVVPRHVAIALSRHLTGRSYPQIGLSFGGRDHTSCLHAYNKHRELIERLSESMSEQATAADWVDAVKAAL